MNLLVRDAPVPGHSGTVWGVDLVWQPLQVICAAAHAWPPKDASLGSGRAALGLCLSALFIESPSQHMRGEHDTLKCSAAFA